jgi:hypothetical protein
MKYQEIEMHDSPALARNFKQNKRNEQRDDFKDLNDTSEHVDENRFKNKKELKTDQAD